MPPKKKQKIKRRHEVIKELRAKYTSLEERSVTLRTWLVYSLVPFMFAFETSLQLQFAYHLAGGPYERVVTISVVFGIVTFIAIMLTVGLSVMRLQWDLPPRNHGERQWDYIRRNSEAIEDVNMLNFLASVFPIVWFMPFVLFQVMFTEINDYYYPKLDYNRVVSSWTWTAILAFFTIVGVFFIVYLYRALHNPKRTHQRQEIMRKLEYMGADLHTPIEIPPVQLAT